MKIIRKKLVLFVLIFLLHVMTVPWFFFSTKLESITGFPYWAFYSLCSTFIYAVCIFYFLQKYWAISESDTTLEK
jgi:hypothetical protein